MNHFFDDYINIHKIIESKREYKRQLQRLHSLPKDYRFVYEEIQKYIWPQVSGAGYDVLQMCYGILDLFEEGAAKGQSVLQITGDDVAAFADGLLDSVRTQAEDRRNTLNRKVEKHLHSESQE